MGRVRPRREAADVRGAHGDPDLLERAPAIRRSLVTEEPAAVRSPGTRGPSGGRPSTGRSDRPSCLRNGGCRASHRAWAGASPAPTSRCARCCKCRASSRSRGSELECAASLRDAVAGGRPCITVNQWRVSARKRRIWRRQARAARISQRDSAFPGSVVVPAVVAMVVLVLVVGAFGATAGSCRSSSGHACEREQEPAGQDRAPQFETSWVDCKSEAERAGRLRPRASTARRGLCSRRRQRSG